MIHEQAIDDAALAALTVPPATIDISDRHLSISAIVQLVNFSVPERCVVKARAIVDGDELKGGILELMTGEIQH